MSCEQAALTEAFELIDRAEQRREEAGGTAVIDRQQLRQLVEKAQQEARAAPPPLRAEGNPVVGLKARNGLRRRKWKGQCAPPAEKKGPEA